MWASKILHLTTKFHLLILVPEKCTQKSNKYKYSEVHFQLSYNKKDQSGLHKYTFWKKMGNTRFLKGKAPQ